ncbi:hypothetical protein IGI04_025718 [Brassica rapa subsp. trilocularis]|uniref:Uncharacterized protein n=1 Tax=Brassica rapa subsp. trilocularis TaxID=1813537 RepID=A0ABQ7KWH7_BRACM|nr:hypothetical protein IGI04_025718 [Brassica rapa subsp. trilocularis]
MSTGTEKSSILNQFVYISLPERVCEENLQSYNRSQPNRRYERDEVLVVVHADHPYELFSQPISQAQTISLRNALLGVEETKRRPTMATVERKSVGWKKTGSGDCKKQVAPTEEMGITVLICIRVYRFVRNNDYLFDMLVPDAAMH